MLFLAGADHERYGKVKWTRQTNLPSATMSLQVVIGLQAQRNGGSETQSRRFIGVLIDCCTTAFFLLPSCGRADYLIIPVGLTNFIVLVCNRIIGVIIAAFGGQSVLR